MRGQNAGLAVDEREEHLDRHQRASRPHPGECRGGRGANRVHARGMSMYVDG